MDTYPSASMSAVRNRLLASTTPMVGGLPSLNIANAIATAP
jgi:hypothetical protein